jgi:predicted ester cyclase
MTIETLSKSLSTQNRLAARQWVDAFNARDDEGEADARTADYIGHAPDSMHLPALDSNVWVAFLGTFLEGFPDLHLDVQDTVADEEMNAQRIPFTGTHTGHFRGLPATGRKVRFSGARDQPNGRREGRRALVPDGHAHDARAARPASHPRPPTGPTADDRASHEALKEVAALTRIAGSSPGSTRDASRHQSGSRPTIHRAALRS